MKKSEILLLKKALDELFNGGDDGFTEGTNILQAMYLKAAAQQSAQKPRKRRPKGDKYNPRDIAILGGDPSL